MLNTLNIAKNVHVTISNGTMVKVYDKQAFYTAAALKETILCYNKYKSIAQKTRAIW